MWQWCFELKILLVGCWDVLYSVTGFFFHCNFFLYLAFRLYFVYFVFSLWCIMCIVYCAFFVYCVFSGLCTIYILYFVYCIFYVFCILCNVLCILYSVYLLCILWIEEGFCELQKACELGKFFFCELVKGFCVLGKVFVNY